MSKKSRQQSRRKRHNRRKKATSTTDKSSHNREGGANYKVNAQSPKANETANKVKETEAEDFFWEYVVEHLDWDSQRILMEVVTAFKHEMEKANRKPWAISWSIHFFQKIMNESTLPKLLEVFKSRGAKTIFGRFVNKYESSMPRLAREVAKDYLSKKKIPYLDEKTMGVLEKFFLKLVQEKA